MPGRPPREWFGRCESGVAAHGGAMSPGAVCGAAWGKKSKTEKSAIAREEKRSMAAKKKKKGRATKRAKKRAPAKRKKTHAKKHHQKRRAKKRAGFHPKEQASFRKHFGESIGTFLKRVHAKNRG